MNLEDKVALLTGTDMWAFGPGLACANGPVGLGDGPLPCPAALGATRDPELAYRVGRWLGAQARRRGVHMVLAPTLDLHADPLAGRAFECLASDPAVVARLGVEIVRGIQSCGVAACVKHLVCNVHEDDRYNRDVTVPEAELRDRWLAPFEAAVRDGGAWAVMAAYNGVNGTRMTEHAHLLRDVLKGEWGFDGVVVSDWGAAVSTLETALGGLDLVMPGPWGPWGDALVKAVRDGQVPESEIDDKVTRILRLTERVTAPFADVPPDPDLPRTLATRSFVLLTNRNVLPLNSASVALIGEPARTPCLQGGGSSEIHTPPPAVSPAEALGIEPLDGVPVRTEPQRMPAAWVPDGFEARLLSASGEVLATERSTDGHEFAWPTVPPDAVEAVVDFVTARPCALAVAGLGRFTVLLNGTVVTETDLTADLAALLGGFARPPYLTVAAPAAHIQIRHAVHPGRPAAFGLGHRPPPRNADAQIAEAVQAARTADIAVVMVGTCAEQETEGRDRTSLALPGRQDDLVRAVAAANPRTVVVVNAGAPVLMPWADDVAAILWTWFGGQEYGPALADVLQGRTAPGGRLPCDLPGFPFGHGLDYPEPGHGPAHPED